MTLEKPKADVKKTLVIFRDPDGQERGKSTTLYHTTPEAAFDEFLRMLKERESKQVPEPSAA